MFSQKLASSLETACNLKMANTPTKAIRAKSACATVLKVQKSVSIGNRALVKKDTSKAIKDIKNIERLNKKTCFFLIVLALILVYYKQSS